MATLADILRQTGYTPDGTTPTDSPMTKVLAEHIKSIPQKFAQNQQAQMDLLGKAYPGNTYESMMTQGDPKALAELAMQAPFNAMVAYHGTPHKIVGNFDINKVGTGEGAQAYGHGMYFAENPKVAAEYRDNLSDFDWSFSGKPYDINNPAHRAAIELKQLGGNVAKEETIKRYEKNIADLESRNVDWAKNAAQKKKEELAVLKTGVLPQLEETSKGNLYKVDIPDEYIPNMLDWDKPISQQSKTVQDAAQQLITKIKKINPNADLSNMNGQDLYRSYQQYRGNNPDFASEGMNELGIKGIRYLDEGSRNVPKPDIEYYSKGVEKLKELYKKQPTEANKFALDDAMQKLESVKRSQKDITSNFVVFDPSTVKILEENGKPLTRKELIEKQVKELKD